MTDCPATLQLLPATCSVCWQYEGAASDVDDLVALAKALRALPVAEPRTPTLVLVGAPNVGKSSLVRGLSSGKVAKWQSGHFCQFCPSFRQKALRPHVRQHLLSTARRISKHGLCLSG